MRFAKLLAVPAALLLCAPVGAIDLTKVNRTIKKEPTYKAKPKYLVSVRRLARKQMAVNMEPRSLQ